MNFISIKLKGALNRIKNVWNVAFYPDKIFLYYKNRYSHHNISFSQEGEDMILSRFFSGKSNGFYIDVGAHHPQKFSNTYYFYLRGWKGINIDAKPGSMAIFNQIRPNDMNLEIAVSNTRQTLVYYEFNEPALNSFNEEISKQRDATQEYKIVSQYEIMTYKLSDILDKYLTVYQEIDFMNIDVEGLDYEVLISNNWEKYRPKIVLVEDLNASDISNLALSKIVSYMYEQNYQLYAKSCNTLIFKNKI